MDIYLIHLEQRKYYVDITNDTAKKWQQYLDGTNTSGGQWTKVYLPIKMSVIATAASPTDLNNHVKTMMLKYGINNVRGGSYTKFHLEPIVVAILYKELETAVDRCYNCGRTGHYASSCKHRQQNTYTTPKLANKQLTVKKCSQCGLPGHNKRSCK
jgi:hypothetical protein